MKKKKYLWTTVKNPGCKTEHSLSFGTVLCRWWGDKEPEEAKVLEELLNTAAEEKR